MALIGAGRHDVKVIRSGLSEASGGDTPQITVQFEDANGNTLMAYLFCTEKAWPYTEEKLKTLGWDPTPNGYRFEELNEPTSPLIGKYCEIVCEDETYDGKTRTKVKYINPIGGHIERMAPEAARSFADKLRKRILSGATNRNDASQQDPGPPPAHADDDLPF